MSETINFTRLTTSDKLPDRFLTCQFYQPIDPGQKEAGVVFSQIEIMTPWFPSSQIGQTVINTLIREYYRGQDTSELVNFENAIKSVNKVLAQIAQNGETDWIGKFGGVLALVSGKEIHIAQTGQSNAYLYRGNRLNHITEGLEIDDAPHPLKTFNNLTSGTLQIGDKIVIGNSAFFETLAPSELKTLVTGFRPGIAALECAKILKSHSNQNANAIFIEITTKESMANIAPDQKIETVYLDKSAINPRLAFKNFLTNKLIPLIHSFGKFIAKGAGQTGKFIAPKLKKGWKAAGESTGKLIESTRKTEHPPLKESKLPEEGEMPSSENAVFGKKNFFKFKNKLRRSLIDVGLYSRDKSKMVLGVLGVVVLVLAITLTYSFIKSGSRNKEKDQKTQLEQIVTLDNEATVSSTRGDETASVEKYNQIIALSRGLENTKFQNDAKPYADKAATKIKAITKLITLEAQKTYDLSSEAYSLALADDSVYAILKNGEIKRKKSVSPNFETTFKSEQINASVYSNVVIEDSGNIALVLDDKSLAIADPTSKTYQKQDLALSSPNQIASFGETLYFLDNLKNQIWKSSPKTDKYTDSTPYLKDTSTQITNAVDLAIDGSVYLLNSDGTVSRFSRGLKISDFQIELPAKEKLADWKIINTSDGTNALYCVSQNKDQTRIVELNKSGAFVAQYELSGAGEGKVFINPNTKEIYVLKDKTVSSYKMT